MFLLTIKFKNDPSTWGLMFQTHEDMLRKWANANAGTTYILDDDFGQHVEIPVDSVAGVMLEDTSKSMLAQIERSLHHYRTQAKGNQLAMNDPVLKTAAMTRGGPALFDPQGNGRMHG